MAVSLQIKIIVFPIGVTLTYALHALALQLI